MPSLADVLALAVQHHQAGNLAQAEQIYRQILQANPTQPNALHLLGTLAHQRGQHDWTVELLCQAIRVNPQVADFHANLASIYLALGRWEEAAASSHEALRLNPDLPQAHKHLGAALAAQNQWEQASACYRRAIALRPSDVSAHHLLGRDLQQQGLLDDAITSFREALRARPDEADVLNSLGTALAEQRRFAEAETQLRAALRQRPERSEGHNNLGNLLRRTERPDEAERSYREALRLRPDNADALNNLGTVLTEQGRVAEAEACFEQALQLRPRFPEALYNFGVALAAQEKIDAALTCYEQAVKFKPDYLDALNNLAGIYIYQGRLDEAISCYRQALAASPDNPGLESNLLLVWHYHPAFDPEVSFAEHARWGARIEASAGPREPVRPLDPDPDRRLRIGYVSPDFREHVMGRYSEAVIGAHDREQFEVFCYANLHHADAGTERIKALANHWRTLADLPDEEAAAVIRRDRVDVLIDLTGHTGNNRLGVFARKPAPVQVTHFGYCDTTGLRSMDYRLTDAYFDPPGWTERYHTETLVRLPDVQWCYPAPAAPEVGPLPARAPGEVTFGSFNNPCKITGPMLALWGRILQALPKSRMVIQTGMGTAGDERVRAAFRAAGIADERVTLVPRVFPEEYYPLFQPIDLCLDTYPYGGFFTTADALWMGVPVVTLAGKIWLSRQGVATLHLAGVADLIAQTPEEYVEIALRLAQDLPRLGELRASLRDRMQRSPLMDVKNFTRKLEAAYREMWRRQAAQRS